MVLTSKDGHILLSCQGSQPVDITDDMADGVAEGTVSMDGVDRTYRVTGSDGQYDVEMR